LAVLAGMKITHPAERWVAQFEEGPTYAARVQAARALGSLQGGAGASELYKFASDRAASASLRVEAAKALAAMRDVDRTETLALAQLTPNAVRAGAVEALAELGAGRDDEDGQKVRARVAEHLASLAEREPSVKARAAALAGLGKLKAVEK